MSETSPRQVLYALVAGGLILVVVILTIGGAAAGLVPIWWSLVMAAAITIAGSWIINNWKRTGPTLVWGIGLFLLWMIGTLLVA